MPLFQLLGGKSREAAAVYVHADGREPQEVEANVCKLVEQGFRYVRIQMGGYGGQPIHLAKPEHAPDGNYFDPRAYSRSMLNMIEYVRGQTDRKLSCFTMYTSACIQLMRCNSPKMLSPINYSFWKTCWRRRISAGSRSSGNNPQPLWRWVSYSITHTNGGGSLRNT
jgi:mannonate dehydratase